MYRVNGKSDLKVDDQALNIIFDQPEIILSNDNFERFLELCETIKSPSDRILQAALRLDQEGF